MLKVAIFGSSNSKLLTWPFSESIQAVAIMGNCQTDLRNVQFPSEARVGAWALFGSVTITVSSGVEIQDSGVGLLGSFRVPSQGSGTGGVLRLAGAAVLGSVMVNVTE